MNTRLNPDSEENQRMNQYNERAVFAARQAHIATSPGDFDDEFTDAANARERSRRRRDNAAEFITFTLALVIIVCFFAAVAFLLLMLARAFPAAALETT